MDIAFKRACEDDAYEVIRARDKSFYEDFLRFGECPGYQIPFEAMKLIIRERMVYIIMAGGVVAGDITLRQTEYGNYWIHCIEVIPEYQHKGIGQRALQFAEEIFTDAKKFALETPVQKERNCCFYEKAGYKKAYEKPAIGYDYAESLRKIND